MLLWCAVVTHAAVSDHVTQYEITWTFDKAYTVGQFANGDWWVLGPVTITGMSPDYRLRDFWDFTASKAKGVVFHWINGWQVNPSTQNQGFDGTLYEFDSTLVPPLPFVAAPGQSIVKAVSDTDATGKFMSLWISNGTPLPDSRMTIANPIKTAGVLTVVGAVPPDSGSTCFRPPYVGTDKPYYSTENLDLNALPSLAPTSGMPAMDTALGWVQRVQLMHRIGVHGAETRPTENMAAYQPCNAVHNDDAALRLLMNDPIAQKMPLLCAYVQYGIDIFYFIRNQPAWPGTGFGVEPGHKLPLAFAARMLNDRAMIDTAGSPGLFSLAHGSDEQENIVMTKNRIGVWGGRDPYAVDQEKSYWNAVLHAAAPNEGGAGDPYGYIDAPQTANAQCDGYLLMGEGNEFKGEALVAMLVPGLEAVWNKPEFFQYIDRYVNHGVLSQPDPCAPAEGTWQGGTRTGRCTSAQEVYGTADKCIPDSAEFGISYGPDPNNHGDCIRDHDSSDGIGRFPLNDGAHQNDDAAVPYQASQYKSAFVNYMWDAYRATVPMAAPSMSPEGGAFSGVADVTLTPDSASWRPVIRFTTDGTDPSSSSALYSSPILLRASCTLKARAFFGSYTPSAVVQASFTITADTQPPVISSIVTKRDSTKVTVIFNELVDSVSARQAANYSINKGISVLAASCSVIGPSVVLTTTAMAAETTYTLTVRNVKDLSNNTVAPGTQKQFTFINFDPAFGLTGYWPFDADAGKVAREMSGYSIGTSYNGTVTGATWTPGRIGQGVAFASAADYVALADAAYSFGMDEANAFTIAFWVKVTGHNAAFDPLIEHNGSQWGACPYSIGITNTRKVQTNVMGSWGGSTLTSGTAVNDSTWCYIALTYRDSARVLYINGVRDQAGSDNLNIDLNFPNDRVTYFGHGFRGILDEVRFYNRALTAAEVGHFYSDTSAPVQSGNKNSSRYHPQTQPSLIVYSNPVHRLVTIQLWNFFGPIKVEVYSITGTRIAAFPDSKGGRIVWNAGNCPSGLYVVKVAAGGRALTKFVQLIK